MATYQLRWKTSALREFKRVDRQVVPRIVEAVGCLASNPFPPGARKLSGGEHTYRIRVGDYRIIYEIFEKESIVEIGRVRHRSDVYRM